LQSHYFLPQNSENMYNCNEVAARQFFAYAHNTPRHRFCQDKRRVFIFLLQCLAGENGSFHSISMPCGPMTCNRWRVDTAFQLIRPMPHRKLHDSITVGPADFGTVLPRLARLDNLCNFR
jgi:hypothetical protein